MQKFFALILASALLLAACGGGDTTQPGNTENQNAPASSAPANNISDGGDPANIGGHLLVWLDPEPWAESLIAAFTSQYPNIIVEVELVGLDTADKLALDGPAGIGADVFVMPHNSSVAAYTDGLMVPYPDELRAKYEDILLETALNTGIINGTLYAAPVQFENIGLFYNKDLIDAPPRTFEELIQFAHSYNDASANKYALRWQVANTFYNYFFLTAFGYSIFGPDMDDYRQFGVDHQNVTEGLTFFRNLREIYPVSAADADFDATEGAFARGEVPLTITGLWSTALFKESGVNFGTAKIPTINGVQPRTFSGGKLVAVSSYSQNIPAAFALVDFMLSEEGAKIYYDTTGSPPAYRDMSVIPGISDDEHLMGLAEQSPFTDPTPTISEINLTWEPMNTLYTFAWDGTLTIEEAQTFAMESYEALLQATGKSLTD